VSFLPARFRPMFDKHAGEPCGGALLDVTDAASFLPFETGLCVVEAARRLSPAEFRWRTEPYEFDPRPAIDLLTGSSRFREALDAGKGATPEIARHREEAPPFFARREPFLLYPDRRPAVVAFVGGHDSGKTTLLTRLVPLLSARGFAVGAIKHASRDFEDDEIGKDSQRLGASGAAVWALVTPGRVTARRRASDEALPDLLSRQFSDCDLVLIEGFKSLPVPKVEVTRAGAARPPVAGALARVSDRPSQDSVPTYDFGDDDGIVAAVLRLAGLDRGGRA